MILKACTLLVLCFSLQLSNAQKPRGEFSNIEKKNLSTVTSAIFFLKNNTTPSIKLSDSTIDATQFFIYDSLVKNYFDPSYYRDSIKDTSTSFEQKIQLQKWILYNIDHYLDLLPPDSIYISPLRLTTLAEDSGSYPKNSLVVYFLLDNTPFLTSVILFNKKGRLFAVSPVLHFENKNTDVAIDAFFSRQKGYHLIKEKLWRP